MKSYEKSGFNFNYAKGAALGLRLMSRYGKSTPSPNYTPSGMVNQGNGIVMKRSARRQRSTFKNTLYKTMSARHDNGEQAITLTHNTPQTLNLTCRIVQGDTNATRDGDSIVLSGLKIKGFYNSATASNGYGFRMIIGYSGEEYTNATFSTSGLTTTELFLPNTATNSLTLGQINPKAFTVLYDERLTCNSQIAAVSDRVDYGSYVPLNNSMFQYQSSGSALGKSKNLYVIILADVLGGTVGVTAAGGTTMTWDFIYKNSN